MLLRNFLLLMNGRESVRGRLCVEKHAENGDIRVPGLPKEPAAEKIDVDEDGRIVGLF